MNGKIRFGPKIDDDGTRVGLRTDEDGERIVTIRKMSEGQPIVPGRELARVDHRDEDGWYGVTTLYKSGPVQVATPAYRDGYDRIFGKNQKIGQA